jgi:hypothetical protein
VTGNLTFDGSDATTAAKPFRFWINDASQSGDIVSGAGDQIPGKVFDGLSYMDAPKSELDTPTKAPAVPMKMNAGVASRLRTLHKGRKAHLHHTEHPNAMPATEHCSGQPSVVWKFFTLTTAVRFRSGMRPCPLCRPR